MEELKKNPEENKEQITKMEEAITKLESCSKCVDDHAKANKEEAQKKKEEATAKAGPNMYEIYNVYAIAAAECDAIEAVTNGIDGSKTLEGIVNGMYNYNLPGDIFDETGKILTSTPNAKAIYIEIPCETQKVYSNSTILKPCNKENRARYDFREIDLNQDVINPMKAGQNDILVTNILKYYAKDVEIDFGQSGGDLYIQYITDVDVNEKEYSAVAYSREKNIYFIKKKINDRIQLTECLQSPADIRSILYHEKIHTETNMFTYFTHSKAYKLQILDNSFENCNETLKRMMITNFCNYLLAYVYKQDSPKTPNSIGSTNISSQEVLKAGGELQYRQQQATKMMDEINNKKGLNLHWKLISGTSGIIEETKILNIEVSYNEFTLKNPL